MVGKLNGQTGKLDKSEPWPFSLTPIRITRPATGDGTPQDASSQTTAEAEKKAANYLDMAKSLAKSGNTEAAINWAQKAISAAPKSAVADEARKLIASLGAEKTGG